VVHSRTSPKVIFYTRFHLGKRRIHGFLTTKR